MPYIICNLQAIGELRILASILANSFFLSITTNPRSCISQGQYSHPSGLNKKYWGSGTMSYSTSIPTSGIWTEILGLVSKRAREFPAGGRIVRSVEEGRGGDGRERVAAPPCLQRQGVPGHWRRRSPEGAGPEVVSAPCPNMAAAATLAHVP